jgi:hypothetical protein
LNDSANTNEELIGGNDNKRAVIVNNASSAVIDCLLGQRMFREAIDNGTFQFIKLISIRDNGNSTLK